MESSKVDVIEPIYKQAIKRVMVKTFTTYYFSIQVSTHVLLEKLH